MALLRSAQHIAGFGLMREKIEVGHRLKAWREKFGLNE